MSEEPKDSPARASGQGAPTIEVFADVACPFTHVGLCRLVEKRAELGRQDVRLWVRSWPLEVVNGEPLDAGFVAEEVDEIREQVAPDLFTGFAPDAFPATSIPAMALAHHAYARDLVVGEAVSLELRALLFERGIDVSRPDVLRDLAERHHLAWEIADAGGGVDISGVLDDHDEGLSRGVIGSPHFFTPAGSFFCPALDISRDDGGHLHVDVDTEGFEAFMSSCFS